MIELHTQSYRNLTFALALGSFLVFCNLYVFQPILPQLAQHFQVSEIEINWVFAASTLALSVCLVPWAITSESLGRRFVMLTGLAAIPVIGYMMLLTESLPTIVFLRACMGVALAAFASVAVAYMVEELSSEAFTRAIGGYIAANSLGGIAGRVAGGVLTGHFDWQTAVFAISSFTLLGVAIVALLLPKQQHFKPTRGLFFHHNRALVTHLSTPIVWVAMIIGGVNFALFVNLYSVMGFRLVAAPHNLPVALTSLIFLCYLAGTLTSKWTGKWRAHYSPITGMVLGTVLSMTGMLVAIIESVPAMLLGLLLISGGAFFTHTLAYAWVSQKATSAKATATALYLVHYYVGGSLGGFFLLYCWQHGKWLSVVEGGMVLYLALFALCWKLNQLNKHMGPQPILLKD
ncbi:MFS transporter [Vibrio hangzhouensis]|uniref:Predicted arabinose efflux permease, MFS family n=1 Tax=Vibrio hangzhouensis TaxID=462991 RepID=A0A1H5VWL2_9VIBR|nr:MFS transporter [Vibrio hangzhouensis]SEF91523.1 Predicted arabinose efflux permease, MFS family [Vibrio hangzhouensis]